jgi:polyisoprenoid-binding protein YceI
MKILKLFLILALTGFMATAQNTWQIDKTHSKVRFTIAHMVISEVEGDFTKFSGTISNTKDDFSDAKFSFTIDVSSVDTDNAKRDGHLKSADFFDVTKYPTITFKSTSITKKEASHFKLSGILTMHGVSKVVNLDLQFRGTIKDPWGGTRAAFKIEGSLKRSEFGLKYNSVMDNGGVVIGDAVHLSVKLETVKAKK